MNKYTTVFLITDEKLYNSIPISMQIGVVLFGLFFLFIIIIFILKIFKVTFELEKKRFFKLLYLSILCFIVSYFEYQYYKSYYEKITECYTKHYYKIIEGYVNVKFIQPVEGHTGGDLILIKNVQFEINYYRNSYYHESINHGGILKNGNYVKVYYCDSESQKEKDDFGDGKIVRIDLRKK